VQTAVIRNSSAAISSRLRLECAYAGVPHHRISR
jgi:hypothetical protein